MLGAFRCINVNEVNEVNVFLLLLYNNAMSYYEIQMLKL